MSVLDFYRPESNQFYWGKYLGVKDDAKYNEASPKSFKYEIVTPKTKNYAQFMQNYVLASCNMVIKTTWNLGFKEQGVIIDNEGKRHLINSVGENTEEEEAQVNVLLKDANKTYILGLS